MFTRKIKMPYKIIFLLLSISSFGQVSDVFEKQSVAFSLNYNSPLGQFREKIKSQYSPENSLGFGFSYHRNPLFKRGDLSSVFIGFEMEVDNISQKEFKIAPFYDVKASYTTFGFRPSIKYFPVLLPKKNNLSFTASAGPKWYKSSLIEALSEDEVVTLFSNANSTLAFKAEISYLFHLREKIKHRNYYSLSIGLEKDKKVKLWDKDKLTIKIDSKIINPEIVVSPFYLYAKLSFNILQ